MLNQYERDRPGLPVFALNTDNVTLTGIANDYHFDEVFSKQLRALGQSGDCLVVYTDGKKISNIARAITVAHDKDITVIALTGGASQPLSPLLKETDIEIHVGSDHGVYVQETQILITHCLCDLIDYQLFG